MSKARLVKLGEVLAEDAVDAAKKAENKFVDSFLALEGESPEDAKQRIKDTREAQKRVKKNKS